MYINLYMCVYVKEAEFVAAPRWFCLAAANIETKDLFLNTHTLFAGVPRLQRVGKRCVWSVDHTKCQKTHPTHSSHTHHTPQKRAVETTYGDDVSDSGTIVVPQS